VIKEDDVIDSEFW